MVYLKSSEEFLIKSSASASIRDSEYGPLDIAANAAQLGDAYSLKPAKLTLKGLQLLKDKSDYEGTYPARNGLLEWVRSEKEHYSNYQAPPNTQKRISQR